MLENDLNKHIDSYPDFPKEGINFKDITPIFSNPKVFNMVIDKFSEFESCNTAEALVAIDARGFLFGSALSIKLKKPLILARKPGKLPGNLTTKKYQLEYGENSLSLQDKSLDSFQSFCIVDDLLATGGTVNCVKEIIESKNKKITGLIIVIELLELKGSKNFNFPVNSLIKY